MANKSINKKYHYLYKTTNLINDKYYYGIHSTNNIDDGYIGSGSYLRNAIHKYGKDNFKREIIKYFDSREELVQGEIDLITEELVKNKYCMNIKLGGDKGSLGMVNVKDKNGNTFSVFCDDPRYLTGELISANKGLFMMKDKDGNTLQITKNDPRYLSEELVGVTTGMVTVKDKNGNTLQVDKNDPRYLTGELVPIWKERKHTEETKEKIGKINSIKQKGENNSQFGKTKSNESKQKIKDKLSKTFYVFDLNNNFLSEEKNINEYARLNNLNPSSIVKVLNGKYKQTGGFKFTYTHKI
jgi:cyclophilin family peptidyl-prolyl cis-trans isomerase